MPVVKRIALDGVKKRGCTADSLGGKHLSSASADKKRGLPRALPAVYPIIETTAPSAITVAPTGPKKIARKDARKQKNARADNGIHTKAEDIKNTKLFSSCGCEHGRFHAS